MQKLRNSDFLKIICYIAIPILVGLLLLSIVDLAYLKEIQIKKDETKYYQTQDFADNYLSYFINKVNVCKNSEQNNNYIKLGQETGNPYYYENSRNYYNASYSNMRNFIYYIIIEKQTGEMYTNIKSNNYTQDISHMNEHKIYWNYSENGKIETNLEYINQKNMQYNDNYYYLKNYSNPSTISIQEDEFYYPISAKIEDYDIYSFFDEEEANESGLGEWNFISFIVENKNLPILICIINVILLFLIAIYLFWAIGHKEGKEITLGPIEKVPYEIIGLLSFISITVIVKMLLLDVNFNYKKNTIIELAICVILYFIGYAICALLGITTIKRIKANKFWESFLTYKIIKWIFRQTKQILKEITNNIQSSKKIFWYYWGFVAISIFFGIFYKLGITTIFLIIFWIWTYSKLRKYTRQEEEIKNTLKNIYEGKTNNHIKTDELLGTLKEMANYINDISDGFSNSIQETLKSERLKTELITNVSHDIKTPLTSIINYVDLLKKENIQDAKIREYIDIIDAKSQRLKKLTEDVVEASKVSSGNIKLNIEEINIKELINQTIGEFKDKFEEKKLKIETNLPKEETKIKADSRYMYRIVENLFSNITKYALEDSRVYIDVTNQKGKIEMSIKNISKAKLNISSDELMQRFVRGDKSRYTEGSGLGLSIAKSLTELQNGKFEIIIDGDLFKVVMQW